MKIRTLIVDDEPLARQRLRILLSKEPDIEIAAECEDGASALEGIERERPDLMFLDVQMPGRDGFAVIRETPVEHLPIVIFTTAYEQHALQAFEAHALDYLLKPFKTTRLHDAVARAREQLANRHAGAAAKGLLEFISKSGPKPHHLTRLSVKADDRMLFIKVFEIDVIEAAGKYLVVHAGKENHIIRESLSGLEAQLDPEKFLRVSRSVIVNLNSIRELQPMFKGEHVIVLHDGRKLAMTRGLREVESALKFS